MPRHLLGSLRERDGVARGVGLLATIAFYMEMFKKVLIKGFCCSANFKSIALSRYQHRSWSSVSGRWFLEVLMM